MFESKITAYYDRDKNNLKHQNQDDGNFFNKMIGIAQKWERAQKIDNDECIEQVMFQIFTLYNSNFMLKIIKKNYR